MRHAKKQKAAGFEQIMVLSVWAGNSVSLDESSAIAAVLTIDISET